MASQFPSLVPVSVVRLLFAGFLLAAATTVPAQQAPEEAPAIRIDGAQISIVEEIEVPALETGMLRELPVREGQTIRSGEVLATLDDTLARLQATQARIETSIAREKADSNVDELAAVKSFEVARTELRRAQEAVDQYARAVSKTEIDRLRLSSERAELAIEQARLVRRAAKLDVELKQSLNDQATHIVDRHVIRSFVDGVIVQLNRHRGEWVEPGTPVMRIVRLDRLRCEARVDASLVNRSMEGRPVVIEVAVPGRDPLKLPGRLTFIDPRISPIKGDVQIWAEFDNPDLAVQPGAKASLVIVAAPTETVKTAERE